MADPTAELPRESKPESEMQRLRQENARLVAENERLRQDAARHRAMLESATDYAIFAIDRDGRITSWNAGAERLLGWTRDEAIGLDCRMTFTPKDQEEGVPETEMALATAAGRAGNERWHQRKDGSRFWGSGILLPLRDDPNGGWLKIMRDRTERRRADDRQTLLLNELSHRVKNSLAVVLSMARQSGGRAANMASFLADFEGRMRALAAAHDLLSRTGWLGTSLRALADAALGHYADERLRLRVEDVPLQPAAAQSLVLALHELMTNALKHGALTVADGRVDLNMRAADGDLVVIWRESGGPTVTPPNGRGFGTTLLERSIAHQHNGQIDLDWRPAGLLCTIRMPIRDVVPQPAI
jgi:PAS domain S-box-containing protein